MIAFTKIFDLGRNINTSIDGCVRCRIPTIHVIDIINYFNALNQLNLSLCGRYMNGKATQLFGVNRNHLCCQSNDIFFNPFNSIIVEYQIANARENLQENMGYMFDAFWPIKAFYNYS